MQRTAGNSRRGRRHRFIEGFFLTGLKSLETRAVMKIKGYGRTVSKRQPDEIIRLSSSLSLDAEKRGHLRTAASCSQFRNCFFIAIFREPTELLYYRAFSQSASNFPSTCVASARSHARRSLPCGGVAHI